MAVRVLTDFGGDGAPPWNRRPAITIGTHQKFESDDEAIPEDQTPRPKTRADCAGVERPCPWVGCRFSLYLDVNEKTGRLKLNFLHLEPDEMTDSCALDVAERGPLSLNLVAIRLNATRQLAEQIEHGARRKYKAISPSADEPRIVNPPVKKSRRTKKRGRK